MRRKKPLRPKDWCRKCGKSLCSCGQPPKLKQSAPRPVNPERKQAKRERNFGRWADRVRAMPCWCCRKQAPSDPAHTKGRQMGGAGGDRRYLLPLCGTTLNRPGCHQLYDDHKLHQGRDPARPPITRREARLAALRLYCEAHPDDDVVRRRINAMEER